MERMRGQVDVGQRAAASASHGVEHPNPAVQFHRLEQVGGHPRADVARAGVDDDFANVSRRSPDLGEGRHRRPLRQLGGPAGKPLHPPVRVFVLERDDVEFVVKRQVPREDAWMGKDFFEHVQAAFRQHVVVMGPHEFHAPCLSDTHRRIGNAHGRNPDGRLIAGRLTHASRFRNE